MAARFDGFRFVEDDEEYELGLTGNYKIDFPARDDDAFVLLTDWPAGRRDFEGHEVINFQVCIYDVDGFNVVLEANWFPGGIKLDVIREGETIMSHSVYGPYADFRQFAEWLSRRERLPIQIENRQLIAMVDANPRLIRRRLAELEPLIRRLLLVPPLSVPTLLTTRHVDAIAQTGCLVSMPGGEEHYYYVLNATDVQIMGNVDRYSIFGIDSLIGLLTIALPTLNVDPRTRAEITRITRIKFTLQPIDRAPLAPAAVGRKRALSIGGGKSAFPAA
jgi:hypothetical protein